MEVTDENIIKKIAKGAGITFIGTVIGMLFAYLSVLIIARFLGPENYGLISLASALTTIASTIVMLGLPEGVTRYVSYFKGKGDNEGMRGAIISALEIVLPTGISCSIALFLLSDRISTFFQEDSLSSVLKIFALMVFFFPFLRIFNRGLMGLQKVEFAVLSEYVIQNIVRFMLLAILILSGYGIVGASFAYMLAVLISAIVSFYFLNKIFPLSGLKRSVKREIFSYSYPLLFSGVLGTLMGWIDTIMLGYFLTSRDVGIYNASLATARLIRIIPASFISMFFPIVTELYAREELDYLKRMNYIVTKWIFMLSLPITILMILFSDFILKILYGVRFVEGSLSLSVLAFSHFMVSTFRPTSHMIRVFGRTKLVMMNTAIGSILNIALNYTLIPIYGINGAAVATGISILAVNILAFAEIFAIAKVQPFKLRLTRILLSSILSLIIVYLITRFLNLTLEIVIVVLLLYLIAYFVFLLIFRCFESEDVIIMQAVEKRVGVKSRWIRDFISRFI